MQQYGLIGNQIQHSLSPKLQQTAFQAENIMAKYQLFDWQPAQFKQDVAELLKTLNGANVTTPYKTAIIPFLDELTPQAQKINAVNTIFRDRQQRLIGDSTDGQGFWLSLAKIEPMQLAQLRHVLIIGCGGAARSIIAATPTHMHLTVANRLSPHFEQVQAQLRALHPLTLVDLKRMTVELTKFDIIIDATTVGMQTLDTILTAQQMQYLNPQCVIVDLKYNHQQTPLMQLAEKNGIKARNGLAMLIGQGCLSHQRWTGHLPEMTEVMKAMGEDKIYDYVNDANTNGRTKTL